MPLVLRKLESNDEDAFLRALTLTAVSDPNFAHYYRPELTFAAFLHVLADAEAGVEPPLRWEDFRPVRVTSSPCGP